jgi:hypothetical protein
MSNYAGISSAENADRLGIRELIESYATYANRRDEKGQMAPFTADAHFVVYMGVQDPKPSIELRSREALAGTPRRVSTPTASTGNEIRPRKVQSTLKARVGLRPSPRVMPEF